MVTANTEEEHQRETTSTTFATVWGAVLNKVTRTALRGGILSAVSNATQRLFEREQGTGPRNRPTSVLGEKTLQTWLRNTTVVRLTSAEKLFSTVKHIRVQTRLSMKPGNMERNFFLMGAGGPRLKMSFYAIFVEGKQSYHMLFTRSKNIDLIRIYRIFKIAKYIQLPCGCALYS